MSISSLPISAASNAIRQECDQCSYCALSDLEFNLGMDIGLANRILYTETQLRNIYQSSGDAGSLQLEDTFSALAAQIAALRHRLMDRRDDVQDLAARLKKPGNQVDACRIAAAEYQVPEETIAAATHEQFDVVPDPSAASSSDRYTPE